VNPDEAEALRFAPPAPRRALDLGCGDGALARTLARRGAFVVALDRDPAALARAARHPRVAYVRGDACATPFREGAFDLVTVVKSLHHLPLEKALAEVARLVRPGGDTVIVGLHRLRTPEDFVRAAGSKILKVVELGRRSREEAQPVIMAMPREDLPTIRRALAALLPGSTIERARLIRFRARWRKPARADQR
jgi:SAM-dependent methyltransferase